ncbi:MAG: YggS family pyridoxal phosphate-dependent enzyme [Candidatus Hydrogenedentes bacterium]|nr:YggS family pyridoxal phosphate-dependent enzyme [Candidatus Hydrogenedentota bacterium]
MEDRIRQNLASIRQRIEAAAARAGRLASDVTLIAVTKSVGLEEMRILRDLGVTHFGENRVDVAREKIETLDDASLTWHMVGNVQRRKAKEVLRLFDTIDAVDRISLAETLQRHCDSEDVQCRVFVEVNISGETQKHGFVPDALTDALAQIATLDRVCVEGLMCMAPRDMERNALLALFRELRVLADSHSLSQVSMGMSGDFEEAVEAGATHVRIGRALFV